MTNFAPWGRISNLQFLNLSCENKYVTECGEVKDTQNTFKKL